MRCWWAPRCCRPGSERTQTYEADAPSDTEALRSVPGRNRTIEVGGASLRSPVRGLRTVRAGRSTFSNTPNPVTETFSPVAIVAVMVSTTAFRARPASLLLPPKWVDSSLINCALFTGPPEPARPASPARLAAPLRCATGTLEDPVCPGQIAGPGSVGREKNLSQETEAILAGKVAGLNVGRAASYAAMASSWRRVRPMSSSPSRSRQRV